MTGTIMQQNLIHKFNRCLNTNKNNANDIINWMKFNRLSTNKTKVEIELKDYINLIQGLNKVLNENATTTRYTLAVAIQEELERFNLEVRVCTSCLKIMIEGYVIDGGMDYYCSDKCLEYDMTLEEFEEAYGDGDTETYWTEWF